MNSENNGNGESNGNGLLHDERPHVESSVEPINGDSEVGRPSKYSEQTVERLCGALADGMPIKSACVIAEIGVTTLSDWRERHPEIEERMSEARERARLKALQGIKTAGEKDWRAHAEWLRLTFPADYRGSANKIEVNTTASASTFVLSVEHQRELQERKLAALRDVKL